MSIRQVLANQYKYPLPNYTPILTLDIDNRAVAIQDDVQYVNVVAIPDLANYGIDPTTVQIFASQVGSATSTAMISGITDFDPVAGTLTIAVDYVNETPIDFKLMFVQEKLV